MNLKKQEIGMDHKLKELEKYASEFNIPIMMKDGITFMLEYIKTRKETLGCIALICPRTCCIF